jgi:hypothetical protein
MALEDMIEAMEDVNDTISAFSNLALQAVKVKFGSQVMSRDEEHVVLLVPIQIWIDLEAHLEMFEAFEALMQEQDQHLTTEE